MIQLTPSHQVTGTDPASVFVRANTTEKPSSLIYNLRTRLWLLDTGNHRFPVTENSGNELSGNCYVVSPKTAFIDYAIEEIKRLNKPWIHISLMPLIKVINLILRFIKIDMLVQVNNWLVSTNIYPATWHGKDIPAITKYLAKHFPDHGILFRSLNHELNHELMREFIATGYLPVPTRQVYLFNGNDSTKQSFVNKRNYAVDGALIKQGNYEFVDGSNLNDADFNRIAHLYNLLYLKKYSHLNPQYSADWLREANNKWLEFCVLCRKTTSESQTDQKQIDGVVGWFSNDLVITSPIVGYDTDLPQKEGLYRQLTWLCLNRALTQKKLLNFSSGAGHFKRLRGGTAAIEFSMIYIQHLPMYRRIGWKILSYLLHKIAIPLLKKYQL